MVKTAASPATTDDCSPFVSQLVAAMTARTRKAAADPEVSPKLLALIILDAVSDHPVPGYKPNRQFLEAVAEEMDASRRSRFAQMFEAAPAEAAEVWQYTEKAFRASGNRTRGRREQASGKKVPRTETFTRRVWPQIARFFRPGMKWRPHAHRLCRENGIPPMSERTLDRLIREARKSGAPIPVLRKRRSSGDATS